MKFGLLDILGKIRFFKGANSVSIEAPAAIPTSYTLKLPDALPDATKALASDTSGNMNWVSVAGGAHTQNTDTGTTNTTFALDSDAGAPILLKNAAGDLQVRNGGDSANANLVAANLTLSGNLTVQGTTTTIDSNTLTVGDNIIVLNNDVASGSPTEDAGVQVRRGASTSAEILWNETDDQWRAGLAGATLPIARTYGNTFSNATLAAGVLTVTHNLGQQYPAVVLADNAGKQIIPDEITFTSTTALSVDLTSYGTLTGTWTVRAIG